MRDPGGVCEPSNSRYIAVVEAGGSQIILLATSSEGCNGFCHLFFVIFCIVQRLPFVSIGFLPYVLVIFGYLLDAYSCFCNVMRRPNIVLAK